MTTGSTAIEAFRGMSFEQFAGTPNLVDEMSVAVVLPRALGEREPFHGELELIHGSGRADAFRRELHVATFIMRWRDNSSRLWVHEKFRGRRHQPNVAEELVYAVMGRHGLPIVSCTRTRASQRVYRAVYDRIMRELDAQLR